MARIEATQSGRGLITELGLDRPKGAILKGLSPHTRSLDTIDLAIKAAAIRPEPLTVITLPTPVEINAKSTVEAPKGPDLADIIDLNEHRAQRGLGRLRNAGRRIAASTAAAAFGVAALGAPVMASEAQKPSAIVMEGQMPSYSPTLVFDGKTAGFEAQAAWINPEKITSPAQAAAMFGADKYSKNPSNWFINSDGGATLEPNSGRVHRVRTNGAVVEAWIKIRKAGRDAETLVANPNDVAKLDITGGTFWKAQPGQEDALWAQVLKQVIAKEKIEQPDVSVLPVCKPESDYRSVTPNKVASPAQAAALFGGDKYTKNPAHWEINQYGGAHLLGNTSAHRVKLAGSVLESWVKVRRQGIDALTMVMYGPDHADIFGGTFWMPKPGDGRALWRQVWNQVNAKEPKEQPGVLVIPVCN